MNEIICTVCKQIKALAFVFRAINKIKASIFNGAATENDEDEVLRSLAKLQVIKFLHFSWRQCLAVNCV